MKSWIGPVLKSLTALGLIFCAAGVGLSLQNLGRIGPLAGGILESHSSAPAARIAGFPAGAPRRRKHAARQALLAKILARVGKNVQAFFASFPDTTCTEKVDISWRGVHLSGRHIANFNYVALAVPGADNTYLHEYRTDLKGNPVRSVSKWSFMPTGFVGMIVHFDPRYQSDSIFRYSGRKRTRGREIFVVGFRQIPGQARRFVTFTGTKPPEKVYLQGEAWIDSKTWQIVRLKTEIEKSKGPLQALYTDIRYSPVNFGKENLTLWLPLKVTVNGQTNAFEFDDELSYSHYMLFNVKTNEKMQTQ